MTSNIATEEASLTDGETGASLRAFPQSPGVKVFSSLLAAVPNDQGDGMAILKMCVHSVMKRFPTYKETIRRLHREDETFQSIFTDYAKCSEALKSWSQSASEEAPARRKEYEELLQDLETEILQYLHEHR